ncbi:long-chain fatty acid--CoA ligase [Candidatus Deferrimicrobium sp.]|uniref:AMP-dependent synthetase/ligase n=1 Tax=Candidatus Deferrimicrobium sp. TaxID=3060586 RepID=UPI002ED69881
MDQPKAGGSMKETTLHRMFLNRIAEGGDAVRYMIPGDQGYTPVTYRQVGDAAREIGLGLMALGLSRGDRVAILSTTRLEWCLVDIGSILGGFVTVPIYPSNLPDQVEYILAHSRARVVFVEDDPQYNKVAGVRSRLPHLSSVVMMAGGAEGKEGATSLSALRERGKEHGSGNPGVLEAREEEILPADDLTIIYTSGTTGPPKGVVTRHSNYAFNVTSALEAIDVPRGATFLQFLPLAHSLGRLEHFLTFDAMAVSAFARSLQTVAEDLATVRPEIMVSVPRLYEKFYARVLAKVEEDGGVKKAIFEWALGVGRDASRCRQRGGEPRGFLALKNGIADRLVFQKIRARMGGRLRFFISGGAPLSREIAEFLHALGVLILEGYGLTETSTVTTVNRLERYKFGTVGKALPGTEIRIASDGEILVRGPHIFREYFNEPAATREAIEPDGWFHTGDIGALDEEGFLRITDRKKDIIVTSGGKNIAPQNLENLLKNDRYVSQAFVYGDRKKYLTALLTLAPEEIGAWAARQGIPDRSIEALAKHPEVLQMMRERVDAVNRGLAPFEQVKKFALLGTDFSQETGELTPTLKVRRKVVIEKYGRILDDLYGKD